MSMQADFQVIFFEQIVKKKKTPAELAATVAIWAAGWLLCAALIWLGFMFFQFFMLALLAAVGVIYGTFKLAARLNLEYEYSVTNGTLDIDKIINRADRKRMISVNVGELDRFGLYDPARQPAGRFDLVVNAAADVQAPDPIYAAAVRHPAKGRVLVIFQPNERILGAVKRALPPALQLQLRKGESAW